MFDKYIKYIKLKSYFWIWRFVVLLKEYFLEIQFSVFQMRDPLLIVNNLAYISENVNVLKSKSKLEQVVLELLTCCSKDNRFQIIALKFEYYILSLYIYFINLY